MARDRKARGSLNVESMSVVMEFGSVEVQNAGTKDEKRVFVPKVTRTYTLMDLPPEIQKYNALHGLKQKLSDGFAAPDAGEPVEVADGIYEQLKSGNWNARGDGPQTSLVIEALARLKNIPVDEATSRFNAKNAEEQKELRAAPQVKAKMAEIQLERAQKKLAEAPEAAEINL